MILYNIEKILLYIFILMKNNSLNLFIFYSTVQTDLNYFIFLVVVCQMNTNCYFQLSTFY